MFAKRLCAIALAFILSVGAILAAIPFSALQASAISGAGAPTNLNYYDLGIDISAWQAGGGNKPELVNFTKLKNSGCKFVILRISYGQNLDDAFVSFYKNARAAGMPLGVYMYGLSTTRAGAVSDAKWVISVIEKYGMYFEYPIYYDIEEQKQINLSASAKNALCEGWCDTLYAAGYYPGIYAGKSQIMSSLTSAFKAKYDLWVPAVATTNVNATQYTPYSINFNAQGFSMWQYSWSNYNGATGKYIYDGVYKSGTTKVKDLDLDVCYKDYPTIMSTYGYNNCGSNEKSLLGKAIELAKNVKYTDYTQAELDALRNAYNKAVAAYNSSSSTNDAYKTARVNLENAMKGDVANAVLSLNKSYTTTAPTRGDIYDDDGKRLTDGSKGHIDVGSAKYACWTGSTEITVDLGASKNSSNYSVYFAAGDWGIAIPTPDQFKVEIFASDSASSGFTAVASSNNIVQTNKNGNWVLMTVSAKAESAVNKRYIKFKITNTAANGYIWMDEVEVISGDAKLSGGAYISGVNRRVNAGECIVFTSAFGTITPDAANHKWTINVIAKWDSEAGGYVVKSVKGGDGDNTPAVTLANDEILIAAHNWESGISDGSEVIGSAANAAVFYSAQVGDVIKLDGVNVSAGSV